MPLTNAERQRLYRLRKKIKKGTATFNDLRVVVDLQEQKEQRARKGSRYSQIIYDFFKEKK